MKTTIFIIIALAWMVYIGEPTINFKPFSITFEKPYLPFATLFLILTITLYSLQYEKIGYKKGMSDTVDFFVNKDKKTEK